MCLGVPRQRRHPVAECHPEIREHRRHAQAALLQLRIADPVDCAAFTRRDDFRARMPFGRMREKPIERQGKVLHGAVTHRRPVIDLVGTDRP